MRIKIIPILILVTLFGCQNEHQMRTSENSEIYVIRSVPEDTQNDSMSNGTITFREFYFDFNIILIDSISEIYFHKKHFYCLTGTNPNNKLPHFRNLKPEYFQTSKNTSELIKLILKEIQNPERVYLISSNDTIRDKRYFDFKDNLSENGIKSSTRTLTEEEVVIMKSILQKAEYRPENIIWERTLNVPNEFEDEINDEIEIID